MLSPQLRRKVHDLWSLFWSSGLSNPLVAIEQITYLLFIRQLESLDRERVSTGKTSIYARIESDPPELDLERCRWDYIRQSPSFPLLNEQVFPWLRTLEARLATADHEARAAAAENGDSAIRRISHRLSDAYFVLDVNKTDTLKRAIGLIDDLFRQLETRSVNADIMGDIFEYLLEEVKESGKNGQFRTPRHVIRFMVQLLRPELGKTVLDPACGSGGFLINSLLYWKAEHTDDDVLRLEWDGTPHDLLPAWPGGEEPDFGRLLHGFDNDRTMVRIAWMNLLLHGLESPEVQQLDALSKSLGGERSGTFDYILANPPFTGSVDEGDLSEERDRFPRSAKGAPATTKSELLFVWLMLDLLRIGGRAAVIVPDGVLFGSTNAHRALRRKLLFENNLLGVISLPANMFQPYSGVKTSILIFQKVGDPVIAGSDPRTREVWFYEVADEAYSLDQKRKELYGQDNDLWDALVKFDAWRRYLEGEVREEEETLASLRAASIAEHYHQPAFWEERWRAVDDAFLTIFPEKYGDKDHVWALHDLWPDDFPFEQNDPRGARQYDDAVLARMRPQFERVVRRLVEQTVLHASKASGEPDLDQVVADAEKNVRMLSTQLNRVIRETGVLDREFDQYGLKAFKTVLKGSSAWVKDWVQAALHDGGATQPLAEFSPEQAAVELTPLLKEFAKLDGYNVWRTHGHPVRHEGKRTLAGSDGPKFVPAMLSWIVPVREWAVLDSWGEDSETGEIIERPTHKDGIVDPEYLIWLRDTLQVFGDDGIVKKEFSDRLDLDCIEALDLNLSAGRHKPSAFQLEEYRSPAEIIRDLQVVHNQVQGRLEFLLSLIEE